MLPQINEYIAGNKDRFVNELLDFLRIPSVSADPKHKEDVSRAANWLKEKFSALGVDKVEIFPTEGHPVLYAEIKRGDQLPTVLVYGHYDVQPADPLDLWTSPPFEPVIRNGNIFARGSCDDKGQVYMHLKALEIMKHLNAVNCNIKFLVEGEEEVGSANLGAFVSKYKEMLKCDVILISDTSILANDKPSITSGLRGLAYLEVEVTGPNRDLHSGVYGGAVDNPVNVLCEMIASLKDKKRRITIPGFYDDVAEISKEERKQMAKRGHKHAAYCQDLGIADTRGEKGYTPMEQATIRPTIDVNGIWGGYTGEGAKTVLPSRASAKISMRLVPNQSADKIAKLFADHFAQLAPPTVKVKVTPLHGGEPVVTSIDSAGYKAASLAMEQTFGKKPIPTREGGSIPIVALFKNVLGANSVLMGFGLNSDAIHSPNEHYGLFNFEMGIRTIPLFYQHYLALSKSQS